LNSYLKILPKNPKLETSVDENVKKYTYKPYYTIRNRKDLINLIKDHQVKGLGGILLDDVQESMTTEDFERVFKVNL
jgi:transcription initiation factor TFIIE subunit beta